MLLVQCNVNGFSGPPATILSALSEDGVITIAKLVKFSPERIKEDYVLIGNIGEELDLGFTDADFSESISAYHERKATDTMLFDESVVRFDPGQKIELDKIEESGRSFRFDQAIENGHVAVLVSCLFAHRQAVNNHTLGMFDSLSDLYEITSV